MCELSPCDGILSLDLRDPDQVRALRTVSAPVRVLKVIQEDTEPFLGLHGVDHPEQDWTDLIWFLRNHAHLRHIKLIPPATPQSETTRRMMEECFVALTDNHVAQLELIHTSFLPRCNVLATFLAVHHPFLNFMTLVCVSGQANEQVLVESGRSNRTLFNLPATGLAQVLEALLKAVPSIHTLQVYAKMDVSIVLRETSGFLESLQQRYHKCWHQSISPFTFKLHNHSPTHRSRRGRLSSHPPTVSPHVLQAMLTCRFFRSLTLSGFTIPHMSVPSDNRSAHSFQLMAQHSSLTELHLCQCHAVEPASLKNLMPFLSRLEILRIQKLGATHGILDGNLTSWLTQGRLLSSLSSLDLQGTQLDAASMEQLCSWSAAAGLVSLSLGNCLTSKNVLSDATVHSFLLCLPRMETLSHLRLGHCMSSCSVVVALLNALKRHDGVKSLEGLKWAREVVVHEATANYLVRWNRYGRRLLKEPNAVPPGLWARILSRATSNERDWTLAYAFLQSGGGTQCLGYF